MFSKPTKMTLLVAACGVMVGMGSMAKASSLKSLIGNQSGTKVLLSDENRENVSSMQNNVGENNPNRLNVNDVISGVFAVEQFTATPPNGNARNARLIQGVGNQELTGTFSIKVTDRTRTANPDGIVGNQDDVYQFTFGADSNFDTNNNGTLVRFYTDSNQSTAYDSDFLDQPSESAVRAKVTDGNMFLGVGLADSNNSYVASGSDLLNFMGNSGVSTGNSQFALSETESGTGSSLDLAMLTNQLTGAMGTFVGSSNTRFAVPGSVFDLSSNFNFNIETAQVVPTPAAIGPGLALLGFIASRRRRRRQQTA